MELSATHRGDIRLLITDVVMPQMGGLELARKLTAVRPEIACCMSPAIRRTT